MNAIGLPCGVKTAPIPSFEASVSIMNGSVKLGMARIGMVVIPCLSFYECLICLFTPLKTAFFETICERMIYQPIILNKLPVVTIKPKNPCNSVILVGAGHSNMASIFLLSTFTPWGVTTWPKYSSFCVPKSHLFAWQKSRDVSIYLMQFIHDSDVSFT